MTSNDVRRLWERCNLSYQHITSTEIALLYQLLNDELKELENSSISMKISEDSMFHYENSRLKHGSFKVNSDYFDNREGITFNSNGFIGFAGWASSENTTPFLNAFKKWVNTLNNTYSLND